MDNLTYLEAARIFDADLDAGKLFWKPRTPDFFSGEAQKPEHSCKIWNTRFAGKEAFTAKNSAGYHHGFLKSGTISAHRLIWLLANGSWPTGHIDHINGVRHDNRLLNLRDVSPLENSRNQQQKSSNTSGATGVYWDKRYKKWFSRIGSDNAAVHLGSFSRFEDAVLARKSAEAERGYHANHGRPPIFVGEIPHD